MRTKGLQTNQANRLIPNTWWQTSTPVAIITLLFYNLIPLFGVLYLGWELYSIILTYWLENGIIGLFNILRMVFARGDNRLVTEGTENDAMQQSGKQSPIWLQRLRDITLIPFFAMHYGIFWFVHGVFVLVFFGPWFNVFGTQNPPAAALPEGILGVIGAMIISHGTSFVYNYLGRGEYLVATPDQLMMAPYNRVVTLHLTIIGGSILISQLGEPIFSLLILIGTKTFIDLREHLREHWRYRTAWR